MTPTNKAKLSEIFRLLKEIMNDNGEQLKLDMSPGMANMRNFTKPTKSFARALYVEFGEGLISPGSTRFLQLQADTKMMNHSEFFIQMLKREIIEVVKKPYDGAGRSKVIQFRFIKEIPA
jgi:hypothetical protein